MYKLILFLKKNDDESVISNFNRSVELLSTLNKSEVAIAHVEPSLLSGEKYLYYCEFITLSKERMDELMASPEGREFNKIAGVLHNFLSVFFINYGEKE